jgi:hypothetical protein
MSSPKLYVSQRTSSGIFVFMARQPQWVYAPSFPTLCDRRRRLHGTTLHASRQAQVAVCSQINTKHINTVWAERTVVECQTVGASRDQ